MAWKDLMSTDYGLMSLFTIGFVFVIGGYLLRYAFRKMDEDEKNARQSR